MKVQISYKNIWSVAYPIIIGSLASNLINVIDTAFIGRLGNVSLGASAIAGTFFLIFTLLCVGLATGSQIIIARRSGEANHSSIGDVFNQNLYLLSIFGIVLYVIIQFLSPVFLKLIITSEPIYLQANSFLAYRAWGIWFVAINAVYSAFYVGMSKTKVLTYSTTLMTACNIILDYGLIFGNLGLPEMGIKGAALASSISEFITFLFLIIYTHKTTDLKYFGLYQFKAWSNEIIRKIIKLAYPTVFQYLISLGSWFMFFVIIEKLGEQALAISNILRSILLLFMMPVWGLSTTTNTMTSNIIGQRKDYKINTLTKRIMLISILFVLIYLPVVVFCPEWLIRIYTDAPELISSTSKSLIIIYLAMITFVPGVILINSLSGTGDTKTAFFIELAGTASYLTYTYFVAIFFKLPLNFIWAAETVYWSVILVLSFYRLRSKKWQKIKV